MRMNEDIDNTVIFFVGFFVFFLFASSFGKIGKEIEERDESWEQEVG